MQIIEYIVDYFIILHVYMVTWHEKIGLMLHIKFDHIFGFQT